MCLREDEADMYVPAQHSNPQHSHHHSSILSLRAEIVPFQFSEILPTTIDCWYSRTSSTDYLTGRTYHAHQFIFIARQHSNADE